VCGSISTIAQASAPVGGSTSAATRSRTCCSEPAYARLDAALANAASRRSCRRASVTSRKYTAIRAAVASPNPFSVYSTATLLPSPVSTSTTRNRRTRNHRPTVSPGSPESAVATGPNGAGRPASSSRLRPRIRQPAGLTYRHRRRESRRAIPMAEVRTRVAKTGKPRAASISRRSRSLAPSVSVAAGWSIVPPQGTSSTLERTQVPQMSRATRYRRGPKPSPNCAHKTRRPSDAPTCWAYERGRKVTSPVCR
jgi:hypothetical protein